MAAGAPSTGLEEGVLPGSVAEGARYREQGVAESQSPSVGVSLCEKEAVGVRAEVALSTGPRDE